MARLFYTRSNIFPDFRQIRGGLTFKGLRVLVPPIGQESLVPQGIAREQMEQ